MADSLLSTDMSEATLDQPLATSQPEADHTPMRKPSRGQPSQPRPELTADPQSWDGFLPQSFGRLVVQQKLTYTYTSQ